MNWLQALVEMFRFFHNPFGIIPENYCPPDTYVTMTVYKPLGPGVEPKKELVTVRLCTAPLPHRA